MKFFVAKDFEDFPIWEPKVLAQYCNNKLQRDAKVVYGSANHNEAIFNWEVFGGDDGEHTHRALLICIEEIERKPCLHEAKILVGTDDCYVGECIHCGAKLKPTAWEVVDEQR